MIDLHGKIIKLLDEAKVPYKESHHEPVRTSEQASMVRGTKLHEGAKALIFVTEKNPIQIIVPGDGRVDKEKVKNALQISKLKMASAEEAEQISSVPVGGIPPFGNLFDPPIQVYVSSRLLDNEEIEFNAGDRSISIRMKSADWAKIVNPIIGDYEEQTAFST